MANLLVDRRTTDQHLSLIMALAEEMTRHEWITSCAVSEVGRFSTFQWAITVKQEVLTCNVAMITRRINTVVDRLLAGSGAHRYDTFAPEAIRQWCCDTRLNEVIGYTRNFWIVEIDFLEHRYR